MARVRMPRRAVLACGLAALLAAGFWVRPGMARAADACQGDLTERIQASYQALRSFEGRFEQEDRQIDGEAVRAGGKVAYLKPGRMRWAYEPPNEQLLVTDGESVWLYDPILDNVTIQPLAELTQGTPLAFLLGAGNLKADFACRPLSRLPPEDGLTYVELVPRKPIPALAFIQLGARPRDARIASLRMVDTQGNLRWVRFLDLRTDVPLAPAMFSFQVKEGMEVITKSSR